jgi:hypothetical protein
VQVFFDFIIAINGVNLESLSWALLNDTVAILDLYTVFLCIFYIYGKINKIDVRSPAIKRGKLENPL